MKFRKHWDPFQMNLSLTLPPVSLFFCCTHIWPCVSVLWSDLSCLITTLLNCSHTTRQHSVCHRLPPHSIAVHQCSQACRRPVRFQQLHMNCQTHCLKWQSYLRSPQSTYRQSRCHTHCPHKRLHSAKWMDPFRTHSRDEPSLCVDAVWACSVRAVSPQRPPSHLQCLTMLILDNSSCLSDLQIPGEDDLEDAEKDGLGCQWCAHKSSTISSIM